MPMWKAIDARSGSSTTNGFVCRRGSWYTEASFHCKGERQAGDKYRARRRQKTSKDLEDLDWRGKGKSSDGEVL